MLVTRDPENVRAIFVSHASSFEIGSSRYVLEQSRLPLLIRKTTFPLDLLRDLDLVERRNP